MRHIIGSSEPDVIIGSDKYRNRGCKKKFMKTTKARDSATCKTKWEDSCIMTSRSCSACGKDGVEMTTRGGWLDPELCAKARREDVEYNSSPQDVHKSPQRGVPTRGGEAPIKTGRAETDEMGREGAQDSREARAARFDATAGGAESCAA